MKLKLFGLVFLAVLVSGASGVAQDWMLTSAPSNTWSTIATSADGTKLVAASGLFDAGGVRPLFVSTNSGLSWIQTSVPSNRWSSVTCSADGKTMVAVAGDLLSLGPCFSSSDGGETWISNDIPRRKWTAVSCSADGSKVFVSTGDHELYTRIDGTWTSNALPATAWTVASSADGRKLASGSVNGRIYTSTNAGLTWITNRVQSYSGRWTVASSADGNKLFAIRVEGGTQYLAYLSTNGGADWSSSGESPGLGLWIAESIATSANGRGTIVCGHGGIGSAVFTQIDESGWVSNSITKNPIWGAVAMTADGGTMFAGNTRGGIHKRKIALKPQLNISQTDGEALLSWIIPSMPYELQQSVDFDFASWQVVTNVPILNFTNLHHEVRLPMSAERQFYRLVATE